MNVLTMTVSPRKKDATSVVAEVLPPEGATFPMSIGDDPAVYAAVQALQEAAEKAVRTKLAGWSRL